MLEGFNWLHALVLEIASFITIFAFIWAWFKSRQDKLEARFDRNETKISELSETCARREETMAAVQIAIQAAVSPLNHQVAEIRHRIDDLYTLQKGQQG